MSRIKGSPNITNAGQLMKATAAAAAGNSTRIASTERAVSALDCVTEDYDPTTNTCRLRLASTGKLTDRRFLFPASSHMAGIINPQISLNAKLYLNRDSGLAGARLDLAHSGGRHPFRRRVVGMTPLICGLFT